MVTKQATGLYGGRTADERRAERRRRLLEAGLEVMASSGWAATTVREICKTAGLNTRYFYECFDGLDELLVAVFDWIIEDSIATAGSAMAAADKDSRSQVHAGVVGAVAALTADPRRARVIATEAMGSQRLTRRRMRLTHYMALMLGAARAEFDPEADPNYTAVQAEALAAGVAGTVLAWLDGRLRLEREELAEYTAQFVDQAMFTPLPVHNSIEH
ncbi:TetR/AcrR family transcriptional regulator [Mycobacteroides abscessus]|uniref:TetR/AcrR family transcriptional regulator n=1 Tax=Mycobacteroides abscessus TaxID=36809 RepID=UPI00119DFD90|nr:TetR/AcrR family transcriptional regulator [Mycobacteroides abscessus]